jgi:hypothetical protein
MKLKGSTERISALIPQNRHALTHIILQFRSFFVILSRCLSIPSAYSSTRYSLWGGAAILL